MNIRKNYKTHLAISGAIAVIGLGIADRYASFIGCLAGLWFCFVMLRNHRCPRCKKYLPLFDFRSTNCRYCGGSLDAEEKDRLVCPNCGKSNNRFDVNSRRISYCGYCGYPLDD